MTRAGMMSLSHLTMAAVLAPPLVAVQSVPNAREQRSPAGAANGRQGSQVAVPLDDPFFAFCILHFEF